MHLQSDVDAMVQSPLNAPNEWNTLREAIVGRIDGAVVPDEPPNMIRATMPEKMQKFLRENAGRPFPHELVAKARVELDAFCRLLQEEGVRVRRPDAPGELFSTPIETSNWKTKGGLYAAMPRDNLLVVDREIIEAPMAWRSRYRENIPYRNLLREYSDRGSRWVTAPRPALTEQIYTRDWMYTEDGFQSVITEHEPTFDAADFLKFGKHLVGQLSHVTNNAGVNWLRSHLQGIVEVTILKFNDPHPMHIDATIMPLRAGLLLINPERVPPALADDLKKTLFRGWDFIDAPRPVIPDDHPLFMTSKWLNMNILSLDDRRVMVEAQDEPMKKLLKKLGLMPIPMPFRNFNSFGGSFHCATLDVVRDGAMETCLPIRP